MKVLFNCPHPSMLTHGGTQIQIEQTVSALQEIGVQADYLHWWDKHQDTQILHQFCSCGPSLMDMAHAKGWKVVITVLLTETCNRSELALFWRRVCLRPALALGLKGQWHALRKCDQLVVGLQAEKRIAETMWGVPAERISVVPLGLSAEFLHAGPAPRTEDHLVCTGRIDPSKNSLDLARLAQAAKVPLLFVGKPLGEASEYWRQFQQLVDGKFVKHRAFIGEERALIEVLKKARGYVLMSRFENWSLAAHEAAACGLPLLLPDQRWARERFGPQASYFPRAGRRGAIQALRKFYDDCPRLRAPQIKLHSWTEVAEQLMQVYQKVLGAESPGRSQNSLVLNAGISGYG